MLYLVNAFSMNMVQSFPCGIHVIEVSTTVAKTMVKDSQIVNAVEQADIAELFSSVLSIDVPCNRATVSLGEGDYALIGQYQGTRPPSGETIRWLVVSIG